MIDLIHAGFDGLERVQTFGNMPGDGHAQPVSFSRNRFESFQLDVISDFDLFVTGVLITLDRCARFFRSVHLNVECVILIFAIDVPSQKHSRSKSAFLLRGVAKGGAKLNLVPNITRGGNSCGQISWAELNLVKM